MGNVGIFAAETVDLFHHAEHFLLGVCGTERGEFNASEEELLYIEGVVLRHFLLDNLLYGSLNFGIIEVGFVQFKGFFIFALVVVLRVFAFVLRQNGLCVCHIVC